jgi:hypothetical protein
MFVESLCDYPPRFKRGQCLEIPDRDGAIYMARNMVIEVPASVVREYARTMAAIDRAIEQRISGPPRSAASPVDPGRHPARGRRVMTGAQWRQSLGQKGPDVASIISATRSMQISMAHASLDDGERTIDLIAATDTPVRRREYDFFGDVERTYDEVLDMSPGSVRLERMNNGAALLDSHDYYSGTRAMIGAIVPGSAKVRDGKLTASAKFSRSENGDRAFQDAKDGILRSVSVGYLIHQLEIDDTVSPPMHRITDWEPHEISAVAIPADRNAGFRSAQVASVRS